MREGIKVSRWRRIYTLVSKSRLAKSNGLSPTTDKIAAQMTFPSFVMFCEFRVRPISIVALAILIAMKNVK